ncbi:uncharacterized protein YALI1_E34832g [Yarrowia lipolytica]|uniref:Uncharacterized protein n=1 Tax=Yarrowia lipolytica TaxID=4952 RepID=A0A1D8NKG8_YARLL|nr:hypothetical protein YALI1_E34832g [Yarrowia lipolytica]
MQLERMKYIHIRNTLSTEWQKCWAQTWNLRPPPTCNPGITTSYTATPLIKLTSCVVQSEKNLISDCINNERQWSFISSQLGKEAVWGNIFQVIQNSMTEQRKWDRQTCRAHKYAFLEWLSLVVVIHPYPASTDEQTIQQIQK